MTLSADTALVMFVSNGGIDIFDPIDGREVALLNVKARDEEDIVAAAFSPGNKRVVAFGIFGSLTVWDLEDDHQIIRANREVVDYQVWTAAFSPDGLYLATPDLFWLVVNDPG